MFKWFVGLGVDDGVWDHSTFSKNRDRLLAGEIAATFLSAVLAEPQLKRLLSSEHFSVDGTLIEAWASMKSFKPKETPEGGEPPRGGRNAPADFKGQKRSNETHRSTTAPDAMLYRKGPGMEAKLCFIGHGLMENRSGLLVDARLTRVSGHAERLAALDMIRHWADRPRPITLGADKGYDAADFVEELRTLNIQPHVAQNTSGRRSAIDRRTTRHRGYAASQRTRKRIEEAFGWIKARRRTGQDQASGLGQGRLGLHLRGRRLQPGAHAEADRSRTVTGPDTCEIIGRWRIVEADLWDCDYLDLVEPAYLKIGKDGWAEFAFGAVQAGGEIEYSRTIVFFRWKGFDEGDEVSGGASAELQEDGSLEIELSFDNSDDATLTARRA